MPDGPEYKVYRSRRSPFGFLRRDEPGGLSDLRRERQADPRPARKPFSWGRVVKWIVVAILAWILLAVVIFFVSAQFAEHSSDSTDAALTHGGSLLRREARRGCDDERMGGEFDAAPLLL